MAVHTFLWQRQREPAGRGPLTRRTRFGTFLKRATIAILPVGQLGSRLGSRTNRPLASCGTAWSAGDQGRCAVRSSLKRCAADCQAAGDRLCFVGTGRRRSQQCRRSRSPTSALRNCCSQKLPTALCLLLLTAKETYDHGLHLACFALCVQRAGAEYRCAHDGDPSRKHHNAYVTNLNNAIQGTELGNQASSRSWLPSTRFRRTSAPSSATMAAAMQTIRCSGRSWPPAPAASRPARWPRPSLAAGRLCDLQGGLYQGGHRALW